MNNDLDQQIAQLEDVIARKRQEVSEAQSILAQLEQIRRNRELADVCRANPEGRAGLVVETTPNADVREYGFPTSRTDIRKDDSVPTVMEGMFVSTRPLKTVIPVPSRPDRSSPEPPRRGPKRVNLLG